MKSSIIFMLFIILASSTVADIQCPSQGKGNGSDDANCDTKSSIERFNEIVNKIDSTFNELIKLDATGSDRWPYHKSNFKKYIKDTTKQIDLECTIKVYMPYFHGSGAGVEHQYCVTRGKERVENDVLNELENNLQSLTKTLN